MNERKWDTRRVRRYVSDLGSHFRKKGSLINKVHENSGPWV